MSLKKIFKFAANVVVSLLILFTSLFGTFILLVALYFACNYWIGAFQSTIDIEAKMFWILLLLAIINGVTDYITMFINSFAKELKMLLQKRKGGTE